MDRSNLKIKIQIIHEDSPYLKEVNKLADANIKTLSFQPYSFFFRYAKQPGIIVALANKQLVGYLIWSINTKKGYATVWQLCVKPEYRGLKIAKILNKKLIDLTKPKVRGIRLECKDNYGIDGMWTKLGYVPIYEKDAKTPGDTLKVWSHEFVHPAYTSIFLAEAVSDTLTFRSAIDAETLYKFTQQSPAQQYSIDWLRSDLGVCITDEIFNEIDRNYDSSTKKYLQQIVQTHFFKKECEFTVFESILEEICILVEQSSISLDEISLRHIARCAASDIPCLITSQESLLKVSDLFYVNFGVRILSLEDMVALREEITTQLNYQPLRLLNNSIERQSLATWNLSELSQKIHRMTSEENPKQLLKNLRAYANQKNKFKGDILIYDRNPYVCAIYEVSKLNKITVPILRVLSNLNISKTLINYIVHELLEIAISEGKDFVIISDCHLGEFEVNALQSQYFIHNSSQSEWIKCCHQNILSTENTVEYLKNTAKDVSEYTSVSEFLISILKSNNFRQDPVSAMDIERLLWPLKIEDSNIPNFIVPIKPEAAKELFDERLAQENLFGVQKSSLFLSLESVYYKSPNAHAGLKNGTPARILWYVSQSKDEGYSDLSTIRACSQVDDVIIGYPDDLHKRFQHLGFYNLKQIQACANKSGKVMAIKFSHTELFDRPVDLQTIKKCLESNAPIQSPRKISQPEFVTLYRLGFNLKSQ